MPRKSCGYHYLYRVDAGPCQHVVCEGKSKGPRKTCRGGVRFVETDTHMMKADPSKPALVVVHEVCPIHNCWVSWGLLRIGFLLCKEEEEEEEKPRAKAKAKAASRPKEEELLGTSFQDNHWFYLAAHWSAQPGSDHHPWIKCSSYSTGRQFS